MYCVTLVITFYNPWGQKTNDTCTKTKLILNPSEPTRFVLEKTPTCTQTHRHVHPYVNSGTWDCEGQNIPTAPPGLSSKLWIHLYQRNRLKSFESPGQLFGYYTIQVSR